MNPLETLKEKLRIKPIVEEREKIAVVVPVTIHYCLFYVRLLDFAVYSIS